MSKILIATILLMTSLSHLTAQAKDLSDQLPLDLVSLLVKEKLWIADFDQDSAESENFFAFFQALRAGDSRNAPELLFAVSNNENGFTSKPELYQAKVMSLRWLVPQISKTSSDAIQKAILEKYFEISISLIRLSNISEMTAIVDNARQMHQNGQFNLLDLSPANREALLQSFNSHHAEKNKLLTAKANGSYLVNGLYSPGKRILAVDISRSVAENIITLSHELVHLADPDMKALRQSLASLTPVIKGQIRSTLSDSSDSHENQISDDFIDALIESVYHEISASGASHLIEELRLKQMKSIESKLAGTQQGQLLSSAELRNWTAAVVEATLGSELKAYVFSLAVYSQLQSKIGILPFSHEREAFIAQISGDNANFAVKLSTQMNPFNQSSNLKKALPKGLSNSREENLRINVQLAKSAMEHHYLEQTKICIESFNRKYSSLLGSIKTSNRNNPEMHLPEWTQPGKIDSTLNPYTILTAKFSTVWAVRFKEIALQFVSDLQDMNVSLLHLKMGVLDLHDLTFGELKLLGIHSSDSQASWLPKNLESKYKKDITEQPEILKSYFSLANWAPGQASAQGPILQRNLAENLFKLRLLKTLHYLDTSFPEMKQTIISSKVFLLKLNDGLFDPEDFSEERILELKRELQKANEIASASTTEVYQLNQLLVQLSSVYSFARNEGWNRVADRYSNKIHAGISILEGLGFESKYEIKQYEDIGNKAIEVYKNKIGDTLKACAKQNEMVFIPGTPQFTLHEQTFQLTGICFEKNLYLLRQPGDHTKSATTFIVDGRPETRIFIGARPVRLEPAIQYKRGALWGTSWK